jgi:hypothetical protein
MQFRTFLDGKIEKNEKKFIFHRFFGETFTNPAFE